MIDTDASFAVTFLLLELLPAVCASSESIHIAYLSVSNSVCSFAFVEYESRRDADDAYHEMHNKRIGRDDLLKIEVCPPGRTGETTGANLWTVGSYPSVCFLAI
jgi:hypothetical protein